MLVLSRLTSFNIWFPRFILSVPCVRAAFLFTVENSPVYLLFLRLSVSGHVGDFRVLPTVCNAAVKINMQVYRCLFPIILGVQAPHPIFFKFALHLLTFTKDLPYYLLSVMKEVGRRVLLFWKKVESKVSSVSRTCRAGSGRPSLERGRPTGPRPQDCTRRLTSGPQRL